ncbi:cupin domain-containing protein [Bosea vaviloviae]|uniref:Cupin n=1 Tax=Bosea vaviloviae TaxID=1526658 RepID=A0A1D7U3K1_9HYPH|nr:cupin domain-containing protein [Bosea vaviloviae]AOO81937.1 cupin [Bosea vaviloviae]
MAKFLALGIEGVEPEEYGPDEGSVVSGAPRFRSWTRDEADGGLSCGIWEATPGKWRFENPHWEYCRILSGVSVVTEDGGEPHIVRTGDSFVLRAGFKGAWDVIETTRKDYVIRT